MPDYRLYRLHPLSGRFVGVEEIHAADDAAAIGECYQHANGSAVELWEGGRKVTRVDALPDQAAFPPNPEGASLH